MKVLYIPLVLFGLLQIACFNAAAESRKYTFEGTVSGFSDDAGYVAYYGIRIGDPVKYIWEVNEQSAALWIHEDGSVQELVDEFGVDKFYANIIDGDYLPRQENGVIGSPGLVAYKGAIDMIYRVAFLEAGRRDNLSFLQWSNFTAYPSTWAVGDTGFTMRERVFNAYGWESNLYSSLTLTNAVPEPEAIWLLVFGLFGVVIASRRKVERDSVLPDDR